MYKLVFSAWDLSIYYFLKRNITNSWRIQSLYVVGLDVEMGPYQSPPASIWWPTDLREIQNIRCVCCSYSCLVWSIYKIRHGLSCINVCACVWCVAWSSECWSLAFLMDPRQRLCGPCGRGRRMLSSALSMLYAISPYLMAFLCKLCPWLLHSIQTMIFHSCCQIKKEWKGLFHSISKCCS